MDMQGLEAKWRGRWGKGKAYEPEAGEGKKKFITAAFPYPNSPQHVGHGRTYTTADIYARYWRLRGYNVLFPMAFHVTGTPILGMAKRLEEGDEELLSIFENIYGIPREKAESLTQPEALVLYFSREIEEGMKEIGYAIDWRRKFYTFDRHFNKFVQWQFRKLKAKGYVVKGTHRVAWCPSDSNVVSAHDTQGDVDPEIEEVTCIKFKYKDGWLVASTYRPETIYGVTNIWVNPAEKYVKAFHGEEAYYISKTAARLLSLQIPMEVAEEIEGAEIVGGAAEAPDGRKVPILSAEFVDARLGTGVVMSVPAHAPYDYLALRDLGKLGELKPVVVMTYPGLKPGAIPAQEVVERMKVPDQNDAKAEDATKELYKAEAHGGIMSIGDFKGIGALAAKEKVKDKLAGEGRAFNLFVLAKGPVFCRCGAQVCVKLVEDQWFLDYGDGEWKAETKEWLGKMCIMPEGSRKDYLATIDWLREKACTRASGLGTPFPFDKGKIIEPLSDSTIYMAFYTIAHLLKDADPEELTEEFFDYVLLGKGKGRKEWEKVREEFLYWYPVDSRHSAGDLIRNHLPFFIFNHVAIFPEKHRPCQIATNGFVMMEGKKMSKSFGNILPLRKAIREYGADVVRFSVVAGADLTQDTNFERSVAEGVRGRLEHLYSLLDYGKEDGDGRMEKWLKSRMSRRLIALPELYEKLEMRALAQNVFYEVMHDLQWYLKRADSPKLKWFFQKWAAIVSPFMPHFAEEVWESVGGKGFVIDAAFPKGDSKLVDYGLEMGEELVSSVRYDVEKIAERIGAKPKKVFVYVPVAWKFDAYNLMRERKNLKDLMEFGKKGKLDMESVSRFGKGLMGKVHSLPDVLPSKEEYGALHDAAGFLSKELGAEVVVRKEEDYLKADSSAGLKVMEGGHPKASNAMPGKPAIVLE
ncbi:MAG: leucine--tRNA ligase [Candidatus ainarchaeum sp.]|nr:leucine--tRNA ligase [Candidatus ainarchaeum sp.]